MSETSLSVAAQLEDLDRIRRRSRTDRPGVAVVMLAFGMAIAAQGVLEMVIGRSVGKLVSLPLCLAALIGAAVVLRIREHRAGIGADAPTLGISGVVFVALFFTIVPVLAFAGPLTAFGVVLEVVALAQRRRSLALFAAVIVAFGIVTESSFFLVNRVYQLADALGFYTETAGYFDGAEGVIMLIAGTILMIAAGITMIVRRARM